MDMPREEGFRWMNFLVNEASARAMAQQSSFIAQRKFNLMERNSEMPDWCQVIVKRRTGNEEHWLMFTPGDETAKKHPAYIYFKDCLTEGRTVLANSRSLGWNCLSTEDEILHMVYSPSLALTKHDMLTRGKKLSKYGI